jgi:lipoprotein NlpI
VSDIRPAGETTWRSRFFSSLSPLRRAFEQRLLEGRLGQVLANAGHQDAAVEQLKKALEMDPNFTYAHVELRQIYRDGDKYDLAMEERKK